MLNRPRLIYIALCGLWYPLVSHCGSGEAIVDANYHQNTAYFTLVSWDGSFLDQIAGPENWMATTKFESRWGDDGSVPNVSTDHHVTLNDTYATARIRSMLNTWSWSPTWPGGFKDPAHPPTSFTITIAGDPIHHSLGYYSLFVKVRTWTGGPTVSCTVSTPTIVIGPVANDATASSSAPISLLCDADTDYKMTVGAADGGDHVPYTSDGQLIMSFDGAAGPRPNIYTGHATKNLPVQTNVRATTVPGTALPGKYTASAVVSIEIL